jgi:cation transport ATPase
MRKSAEAGKPAAAPAPRDPKSTPEYQASEAKNRDAEAERLRQEQAQWKAEREAREKVAADEKARREAIAVEQWNERQRQQAEDERLARERQATREQERAAAEERERADRASRERWHTFGAIVAGILVLPSVIASFRDSPQRPAIAGLVVCSLLSALAAGQLAAVAPVPILLWSTALALSLWRFKA